MKKRKTVVVMAIKPKYAEAIYAGKKFFEFRKAPPPVPGWVLIYESAPVSAITGTVYLAMKIQGVPETVWKTVTGPLKCLGCAGITYKQFHDYTAGKKSVAACACFFPERFEGAPFPLAKGIRPPQNWGRYILRDESEASNAL